MTDAAGWAATGAATAAALLAGVRWLRVAQREHYLADATSRFALRWWSSTPTNVAVALFGCAGLALSSRWAWAAAATAAAAAAGPIGLGLRGRSAPLAFTRRLRTLGAVYVVLVALLVGLGAALGHPAPCAAASALGAPALVDLACALLAPFETMAAERYVRRAQARLERVRPTVVAITGSYGKTSTKQYVAHLLGAVAAVVASPQSFNNRAGLARTVNEHLAEGTEVFVAEMGTYGKGEIAELCAWLHPAVSVVTAIGPVHLERMKTEEAILEAKSEILAGGAVAVLATDDARLAALAERHEAGGGRVVRCSTADESADVCVAPADGGGWRVLVGGVERARPPALPGAPSNVACAVGVVVALAMDTDAALARLSSLPSVQHRLEAAVLPSGVTVLDDTYNANPAGTRQALAALARLGHDGHRRVVVTPGMVELGRRQKEENARFGAAAAAVATDVVVVGRTNRGALTDGIGRRRPAGAESAEAPRVMTVRTREAAVEWVRQNLGEGDVVLYENDLPDHYP